MHHFEAFRITNTQYFGLELFTVRCSKLIKSDAIFATLREFLGNSGHLYSHMKGQNWTHRFLMYHQWNIPKSIIWPKKVKCYFSKMVHLNFSLNVLQSSAIMWSYMPKVWDFNTMSVLSKLEKSNVLFRNPHPVHITIISF